MYWVYLIAANIPLYMLVAWLVFDDLERVGEDFFLHLTSILIKTLFPFDFRKLYSEVGEAGNSFDLVMYLLTCVVLTWGEHYLLMKYIFTS